MALVPWRALYAVVKTHTSIPDYTMPHKGRAIALRSWEFWGRGGRSVKRGGGADVMSDTARVTAQVK